MKQGEKLVWLFVAALAGVLLVAELALVEDGGIKYLICATALAIIVVALLKQRQEEPGKKRGG